MINKDIKYSYNDIALVPSDVSSIEHRDECNVFKDGKLPLFTAPMSSVVDEYNFKLFEDNGINAILPRTIDIEIRKKYSIEGKWSAYSLNEFEELFCSKDNKIYSVNKIKALVDVANGHMSKLFNLVKESKMIYSNEIEIMIGNIANPNTYYFAAECGADYVRLGIGAGLGCFVGETKIICKNNIKSIENIENGDCVLTHDGTYKNVVGKTGYLENDDLIKINNVVCTKNHEFYVINKTDTDKVNDDNLKEYGYWISAENLDKTKHFLLKNK